MQKALSSKQQLQEKKICVHSEICLCVQHAMGNTYKGLNVTLIKHPHGELITCTESFRNVTFTFSKHSPVLVNCTCSFCYQTTWSIYNESQRGRSSPW